MTSCGLPTVSGVCCVNSSRLGPWPYTGALSKYGRNSRTASCEFLRMKTWPPRPTIACVGGAVAVVLEALAVERDHALGVRRGPEDVVREEAVAVEGGLLGDLGAADRAVPDERRHVVERARGRR